MPSPISLQMYTVRELTKAPDDYRKVIREIAAIGYAGIEGGVPADMKPTEFKSFLADLGMVVSSIWETPKSDNVNKIVDTARALDVKHVINCWGPDNFTDLAKIHKTATFFQEAAELIVPHGLEMLYHNHWWEFAHKVEGRYGWDVLMELAPTLRCEIDLYWASNFGEVDVPALARHYGNRTPLVHAKDGPLLKDQPNTAVGSGKFDITAAIKATDAKTLKWVVVELDAYVHGKERVMEAVKDSYTFLTKNGLAKGRV